MPEQSQLPRVLSFGVFEVDIREGELRKSGVKLKLQDQPLRVLCILLEHPGEMVTREELRSRLWPADTFVDFDHGLNAAIKRLRDTLGDSADNPHLIETLPRRGYRFIGTIMKQPVISNVSAESGEIAAGTLTPVQVKDGTNGRLNWLKRGAGILVIVACTITSIFSYNRFWRRVDPPAMTPVPFTTYPGFKFCPTFSPDGSQIAFAWNGDPESGSKGFDLYVKVVGSENLLRLTHHPSEFINPAWSPDGTQIAFQRISDTDTGVFLVPALGGSERRIRSTRLSLADAHFASISWSPDGKSIAFADLLPPADSRRLYLLSLETLESKQISHLESCLTEGTPAFSHSGKQLAYLCLLKTDDNEFGIYSVPLSGGPPMLVTSFMTGWGEPAGIAWTANDKKLILSRPQNGRDSELDEVTLAGGTLRKLPYGQGAIGPAISTKGDKLAYVVIPHHNDIWRKDLLHPEAAAVELFTSTQDQSGAQYSPDGKHIAFESTRGGSREIWMSDADGTHLVQMSDFRSSKSGTPRWSPDSQKIAFDSRQSGHPEVYIVDISERMPRKVVTNLPDMSTPSWSHDGNWLYFKARMANTPDERIFRCPASGGNAVALSVEYGAFPLESYDGETVYFANRESAATLDMVSLKQVGSQSVLRGMPAVDAQSLWTVVPGGIYFVPADGQRSIRYFDFATQQIRQIFELDKEFDNSLSVSPDGRWILYTQIDEPNADILLVDHFQ